MSARWWVGALALGLGLGTGCAGRSLAVDAEPGGNLLALTAKHGSRDDRHAARHTPTPLIVLIERTGIRAIDPVSAEERWTAPVDVAGHPTATPTAIYVPISGHRLAALDRASGDVLWKVELPGEALSGIAATGATVVATVVDHRKGRSRAVGLSAMDGQIRWMRRSDARLGAPAVVGKLALVPVGNQVVALGTRAGWERARLGLGDRPVSETGAPAVERVVRDGDALFAGTELAWVDLRSSTGGHLDGLADVDGYGDLFRRDDGLDDGHSDRERLRMWVDMSPAAAGHRNAVFVCRRAVVALRIDEEGLPSTSQWTYLSDDAEFVGFDVLEDRVVLVREDGLIVQVSRTDGAELDRIAGGGPARGALILDLPAVGETPSTKRPSEEQRLVMIRDLLLDPDPRILPAQQLAVELLWRDEDGEVRDAVAKIAQGAVRGEATAAAQSLRAHALDRLAEPWGRPDAEQMAALRRELAARPAFLDDVEPQVGVLARRAVAAGDASMIGDLVELLMHPSTDAGDLDTLVRALGELGSEEALVGVARFLRRYHADGAVLYESAALTSAVDVLVSAGAQRSAMEQIVEDPFTEPALRDYIAARLPTMREAPPTTDDGSDPPELAALSTPGL